MKFRIEKDNLILLKKEETRAKAIDVYNMQFEFSEEWTNLSKRLVIVKENKVDTYEIDIANNEVILPSLENGVYYIGVVGFIVENETIVKRIATNLLTQYITESSAEYEVNKEITEEEANAYERYIQRITDLKIELDNYTNDKKAELDTKENELETILSNKEIELENQFNTNAENKISEFNEEVTVQRLIAIENEIGNISVNLNNINGESV